MINEIVGSNRSQISVLSIRNEKENIKVNGHMEKRVVGHKVEIKQIEISTKKDGWCNTMIANEVCNLYSGSGPCFVANENEANRIIKHVVGEGVEEV